MRRNAWTRTFVKIESKLPVQAALRALLPHEHNKAKFRAHMRRALGNTFGTTMNLMFQKQVYHISRTWDVGCRVGIDAVVPGKLRSNA